MHVIEEQEEKEDLGNARLALIMGNVALVVAIVTPVLYFIGIVMSIASALFALMLYNRDNYTIIGSIRSVLRQLHTINW